AAADFAEQRRKVHARPEAFLEIVGVAARGVQHHLLAENDHPRGERENDQDRQHQYHRPTGMDDQIEDVDGTVHSKLCPSIKAAMSCGIRHGVKLSAWMQATRTVARASVMPSATRVVTCAKSMLAARRRSTRTVESSSSSSRAGLS